LFCVSLAGLLYGQSPAGNLVEPRWKHFTGVPPEEVTELSGKFGLSFADLRVRKPNLKPVTAAAKDQYQESTICDIDGSTVTMTAIYYIDEKLGYYAATLEIESDNTVFINNQFAYWEKLIRDTLNWGSPGIVLQLPVKTRTWQQRNRWPAITISQMPVSGTMHRVRLNQYSQLGINRKDPVNHKALVQRLANSDMPPVRR
jgi:hypothetical protein